MGILSWLEKKLSGDDSAKLTFDKGEEEFAGLNLRDVLNAHLAWNDRLKNFLEGKSDEKLDVQQIAPDNLCILGKWIYGPGEKQFNKLKEFNELKQTHTVFHRTAGQIVAEFGKGNTDTAVNLLRGNFRSLSSQIQLKLINLYGIAK